MTARPIVSDCRRRPVHVAVALVVVMVAVLLAAGCSGENPSNLTPGKSAINNTTSSITTIPVITIPIQTITITVPPSECPGKNSKINSVLSGNSFIFSGTAIRPEENLVRIWVFGDNFAQWFNSSVRPGVLNTISLDSMHTSNLKSGTYYLLYQYSENGSHFDIDLKNANYPDQVKNKKGDLILDLQRVRTGFVKSLEARTILEQAINTPGNNDRSDNTTLIVEEPWIIINPLKDVKKGTSFTINGTTNLPTNRPKNMKLKLTIWPTKQDPRRLLGEQSVEDYGSAFSTYLDIESGENCTNTFSILVPPLNAKTGEYFVSMFDYDWDKGYSGHAQNGTVFNIN